MPEAAPHSAPHRPTEPLRRDHALRLLRGASLDLRARGLQYVGLFGSVARDEARPDSDVDLLVEFDRPVGLFELHRIQLVLEALLERRVDLVTRSGLKKQLTERILAEVVDAA